MTELGRRRIPMIRQQQAIDCGPACLAMVLGSYGCEVGIEDVRTRLTTGRDGASALDILNAARWFGMRGRGVRLELADLSQLDPGAILHWDLRHFVVLDRVTRNSVWVLDPAVGRRRLSLEEVGRSFTGIALELEPAGDFQPRKRGHERLWRYVGQVFRRKGLLARIAVASLLLQGVAMTLPLFTGMLVDQVVPRGDASLLLVLCAGGVAIALGSLVVQLVRGYLLLRLRVELDVQMSLDLVEHMSRLPFSYFQTRPTGDLMQRLNSPSSIREILTSSAVSAMLDGTLMLGYLALLLWIQPALGLLVLSLAALRLAVYFASRGPVARLTAASLQAQGDSSSHLVLMLQGMESLKAAGAETRSVERWSQLFTRLMNITIQRGRVSILTDGLLNAITLVSPILVLGYGAHLVLGGTLSLGSMLAISALAAGVFGPLTSLTSTALQFQQLDSHVERVEDVLQTPLEQTTDVTLQAPCLQGGVRLESVSFSYSTSAPRVVKGVSLAIHPGQQVAIVGPSGSGKSTIARLILGLYVPTDGTVYLDDHPLPACDLTTVRRQIGFVPQQPQFFDNSIRENIALGDPNASLEDVQRASRVAAIHDEIEAMPLRYDTMLGAAGGTVSGGQRQRIAIARALLTRPRILILDEATSNLDGTTERIVYENLAALGCTCVLIAHRLSTIARADTIVVMKSGLIVESGTHDELMDRPGAYARLVSDQVEAS